MKKNKLFVTEIQQFQKKTDLEIPLVVCKISAGFPSPADDYIDKKLDLNEFLIKHPAATFFVKVDGDSMIDAGIHSGDILIVDRAVEPTNNCIAVVMLDGEFTVKRLHIKRKKVYLLPENPDFKPIEIKDEMDCEVWGIVTFVIHKPE
ncbi:MAG: translesion error-prone DNA polymerase V autoproteolytic subunit [Candidatus Auribacterota bacterium]